MLEVDVTVVLRWRVSVAVGEVEGGWCWEGGRGSCAGLYSEEDS